MVQKIKIENRVVVRMKRPCAWCIVCTDNKNTIIVTIITLAQSAICPYALQYFL